MPSQRSKLANYLSSGRILESQQTIAFRVVEGYQVLELACLRVARFAFPASRSIVGLGIFPAIDCGQNSSVEGLNASFAKEDRVKAAVPSLLAVARIEPSISIR